jgi:hypothetical protein
MNKDEALKLALEAHQAMREWIDAVPDDTVLPAMPGCDGDWLDTVEAALKQALAAQPAPVQVFDHVIAARQGFRDAQNRSRQISNLINCGTCGYPLAPEERTSLIERDGVMVKQAPVQEPVAVIGSGFQLLYCREDWAKGLKIGDTLCLCTPPAAQRPWIGLTDEDKLTVRRMPWETLGDLMDNTEAKLKQKNAAAQPAVPDAMTSADIQEHIEYVAGWNDCRQAMLEMMK